MVESKEWYMASYAPDGVPTSDHLKLQSVPLELALPEGHVALQTLWISVDPYLRPVMTGRLVGLYIPSIELNQLAGAGGRIRSTLDVSFDPVTVPFDVRLCRNAVDLPETDSRVRRSVRGFEPEQISLALSADFDYVWVLWITGSILLLPFLLFLEMMD